MKVAVIAATGSTGSLVVDRLIADGHTVVAVSRSPAPPRSPADRFATRVGDLTDVTFLRDSIAGCDAIVSCLGQKRASKSLFAKRTSPPDISRPRRRRDTLRNRRRAAALRLYERVRRG